MADFFTQWYTFIMRDKTMFDKLMSSDITFIFACVVHEFQLAYIRAGNNTHTYLYIWYHCHITDGRLCFIQKTVGSLIA